MDTTPSRRQLRFHLSQRAVLALVLALLVLVAITALWHLRSTTEVAAATSSDGKETNSASAVIAPADAAEHANDIPADTPNTGRDSDDLIVYVTGAVNEPGLYHVSAGSRVSDAISAAGNFTDAADITALNLARIVADGEHLHVTTPGEPPKTLAADTAQATNGPINLNTADATALETLPGIGPALAQRIITHRQTHGDFTSVEQLLEVSGIGPAILANIGELVVAP